jgi:pyruvate ferredoxin oxidoreductase alpha subunit
LMFYGETNQEVCDLHVLAFKVAEQLSLPVMVNLDGFVLTHTVEAVDVPDQKIIKKYLPAFNPKEKLDPKNPLTFGAFATPQHYLEIRQELHDDIVSSKKVIAKEMLAFKKIFGRDLKLAQYFGDKNAETVLVAMGSVLGTIKEAVSEMKKTGKKVGVLKVVSLRPFPTEEILKLIDNKKNIIVIDKSVSLGEEGILAGELKRAFYGNSKAKIKSVIMGLGGRDITKEMIKKTALNFKSLKDVEFVGK